MKKLFFLLLVCFVVIVRADIPRKKQVLILHSYSQEYSWTKSQHNAFVAKLKESESSPIDISVEYLDTKRVKFSPEYQKFFLSYLQKKYEDYTPDAIYVTDDNAMTFFLNHKSNLFADSPLFFSGINDLSIVNSLNHNEYTGVFESKDIVPNIELIRVFSPQTRDIWIVGDDSTTYRSIETEIRTHIDQYPKYLFHFISSDQIDTILAKLPTAPKSFVLLTTIGGLKDADGRTLTLNESIDILKQKHNLILCSMEDAYVTGGVIGGYVTSGTNQGDSAAKLLVRYLNGEPLKDIYPITKSPNIYMFDRKAVMDSRLVLSEYTARGAVILHKEKTFFDRYQETILGIIFVLLTLFVIIILISFFIILQKNAQIKRLEEALEESASESGALKNEKATYEQSKE